MTKPERIVDHISRLADDVTSRERKRSLLPVKFQGGESAYLDMSQTRAPVWAEVLQSLRDNDQPVYVELDSESRVNTQRLLPRYLKVEAIRPADKDAVEVELVISHARHFLSRKHSDYERLLKMLEAAQKNKTTVLVTEDPDTHTIIDVRPDAGKRKKRRR